MLKHQTTTNLVIFQAISFVFTIFIVNTATGLSDKRLCADENCKRIISMGRGLVNYHAGEKGMVSFKTNSIIRIKSKSAGSDPSVWGVEVNGREGFAPKKLIREEKILVPSKDLKFEVDTVEPEYKQGRPTENNNTETLIESTTIPTLSTTDNDATVAGSQLIVEKLDSHHEEKTNQLEEIVSDKTPISSMDDGTVSKMENIDSEQLQSTSPSLNMDKDVISADKFEEGTARERSHSSQSDDQVNTTFDKELEDNDFEDVEIGDYDDEEGDAGNSQDIVANSFSSKEERQMPLPNSSNVHETTKKLLTENVSEEDNLAVKPKEEEFSLNITNSNHSSSLERDSSIKSETADPPVYNELSQINEITHSDIYASSLAEKDTAEEIEKQSSGSSNINVNSYKTIVNDIGKDQSSHTEYFNDTSNQIFPTASSDFNHQDNSDLSNLIPHGSKENDLSKSSVEFEVLGTEIVRNDNDTEKNQSSEENYQIQAEQNVKDTNAPTATVTDDTGADMHKNLSQKSELSGQFAEEVVPETASKYSEEYESRKLSEDSNLPDAHVQLQEIQESHKNSEEYDTNNLFEGPNLPDAHAQLRDIQETHKSPSANTRPQYNPYENDEILSTPLPSQYIQHNNIYHSPDIPDTNNYEQQNAEYTTSYVESDAVPLNPSTTEVYPEQSSYDQSILKSEKSGDMTPQSLLETAAVTESVKKENNGLFATIMDTVNNILPNSKKQQNIGNEREILLDKKKPLNEEKTHYKIQDENLYCEKLDFSNCPDFSTTEGRCECECSLKTLITSEFTVETFLQALANKALEISHLIAFLAIVASASLFFIFGYYCFCNSSCEGALLSKLNQLESSLLASQKENLILKHNLMSTRHKLASIEDNSFGSNDMVVSLRKELEEELLEKARLQEQIVALQKELENAADAGIELNKIVSELLSNQTGDESIISSVEELQKQLNEQQNTILEINTSLAEKSRENSELQLMIAEQSSRYQTLVSDLQQDNDELESEKSNLQIRLEEIRADFDQEITSALESKNFEINRLQIEIVDLKDKAEAKHTKWQTSLAKVEALEECLKNIKKDTNVNIAQVMNVVNVKAELLDVQKKLKGLKERLELEQDARKLAEGQLESATNDLEKIKQHFNQTEKDKLEAQTRLEVLSNYFKEKENQLQKELSLKETMWLKQQGETTTTVERLTTMQGEIQSLKSQNDALRAEIEAQDAAHKAQTGTLENRAHETWLAARQSDRRYEEARAEATALRRKLTALAGSTSNELNKTAVGPSGLGDDLVANAPSPIRMESPGSPMLSRMPPPFLPPPFLGPPPPFLGMPPPPPFVPPGEMRPAPLGRIMSPPPSQRSGHLDYEDYLDYEGSSSWHRHHTYSPPPRTYRSVSPTDNRYNYGTERDLMSTYDTETDYSPPPSPRDIRRRGTGGDYGSDKEDSAHHFNNSKKITSVNNAPLSSGSDKSYKSSSIKGSKSKSSGGKYLV